MQTSLETLGQLERRLNVAVPLQEIESEIEKRLHQLARNAKIPGFRPGKVPMKMVAQQYGRQVRSDVISETVQSSLNDAIRGQNLRIAGQPRIEPKTGAEAAPDQLEFSAIFEIYPEIHLGDMSSASISVPVAEVGPEDVLGTIEVLRRQKAAYEPVTRPAEQGDRVVVDFTGCVDGVEFPGGQARDFAILLGEGRMLPEFETAIAGMQAGETKSFDLVFPADYHGKEVAGKKADFTLTAKSVAMSILPEVDAAFAQGFGIASGSIDELKSEIAANLKFELKRKIEARVKEQVLAALRERVEFAIPKSMVELEAESMMERMAAQLKEQGMKAEDIKLTPDMFQSRAEDRVALGLIVNEMVRVHNLQAKPEQVKALVQEAAQTYEQPEAVVRWHYEKRERLNEFEAMAVERNVVDWVLGQARVTQVPAAFADLMSTARNT